MTIASRPGVPPTQVKEVSFEDEWAAIAWMCANQLGRRNISDVQRTVLLGELYKAKKNTQGGDRRSQNFSNLQNGDLKKFRNKASEIAHEQNVGENTVLRAERFVKGLDAAEDGKYLSSQNDYLGKSGKGRNSYCLLFRFVV